MPAAPSIQLRVISVNDSLLRSNIVRIARATGKTVKDQTFIVFKGMLRDALAITPPGSYGVSGPAAKRAGEAAIARDLKRMGFAPKQIKGYRTITQAFGRPISPVRVATKENPQFAEPDIFHLLRLRAKGIGRVSRGRKQAFYVSRQKFNAMKRRLFEEVGLLASGWAAAALDLGVPVPAFIKRYWASGRGTQLLVSETETSISLRVTNHMPDTAGAIAGQTQRAIAFIKKAALGRMVRQLPFILRSKVRAAKS